MRIVFIGTTEFGIPTLDKLKGHYDLALVVTQPDKPVGRKQVLTPPPVKLWAHKLNIPVLQPTKIIEALDQIKELVPDLIIVAAYGQIIPKEVLEVPKFGSVNIHGSLLPKYRGASPIQTAILNGDTKTGITLIKMDEKMDHGPIYTKKTVDIDADDDYPKLYKKLALHAAELVVETLPKIFEGLQPAEQIHDHATFTKLLDRKDGKIDWTKSAKEVNQKIKALNPEPGTWTTLDGKIIKILKASLLNESKIELPGKIYSQLGQLAVKTLEGSLLIDQIQPEGKSVMSGKDFLNGLKSGSKLFI